LSTLGERDARRKRILIVCQLDGYANELRPIEIQRFLRSHGHDVQLANTYYLSRASKARDSLRNKLPSLRPKRMLLYAIEAASLVLTRRWGFGRRHLSFYSLVGDYYLRRSILGSSLDLDNFDLVICESPHDAGVLTVTRSARTLYDCPTPWADEIYYEGRLTGRQHRRLRRMESRLYESVDQLAFYWQSYARYAVRQYGISGRNILTLDFGCTPAEKRADFKDPPRVIYLGSLSSRFIDLPLLSRLSRIYPHIDVYGGPPPDPKLGLNFLGYAHPSILQAYQLGLITCTRDELRRDGFSAKHLHYLAYGLPVLAPAWRRHMELLRGTIAYDEDSFLEVIQALSDEQEWRRRSDEAYAQAQRLAWTETLQPLDDLARRLPNGF
jgi:hypothetical protein